MGKIIDVVGGKCDSCGHHQQAHTSVGCSAPSKDDPEEVCSCSNTGNY